MRSLEIVSGGQTGVDRGALDAALKLGTPAGGWCPEGRTAEDGPIPDRYPLTELKGGAYAERTRRNVEDSDGTLVIHCGPFSAGTLLTVQICAELLKPFCLIDAAEVSVEKGATTARAFVDANDLHRLNVAGPRASLWPEARSFTAALIRRLVVALNE